MAEVSKAASRNPLSWLGGHGLAILLVCLLVVGGTTAFFSLADLVEDGTSRRFDEKVLRAFRRPDDVSKIIGPPWTEEAARDLTALGGVAVVALITIAVAGYLLIEHRFASLLLLLGAIFGGLVFCLLLQHAFHRDRPNIVPQFSSVFTTSFPSGHSVMSAIVYLTLGSLLARFVERRRLKLYFLSIAILTTFLVGVSRVVMGVHWPTDVLAGWSAGLVWALLCWLLARYLQRERVVESADKPAATE